MTKIREAIFKDFKPCSDGYCVIGGEATRMHTNGGCKCLFNLSRAQLHILTARLRVIGEIVVDELEKQDTTCEH